MTVTPTKEKLGAIMLQMGAPSWMMVKASEGYYDDYESPLPDPIHQLVKDTSEVGLTEIAQRAKDGEFDGTDAESLAWAESPEGQEIFKELKGLFG